MADGNDNATKKLIRYTATRLFQQRSFEEVTISDICQACGVAKHTFYYYFKSKDDLLSSYYRLPWNLDAEDVTKILTSDNYVDQLWLIFQKFAEHLKASGVSILRQILIKNLSQDVGTFRPSHSTNELSKLQISIIKKGQEAGQIRNHTSPEILVILLKQMLYSTSFLWAVFDGEFDINSHLRFLLESLLDVDEPYRTAPKTGFPQYHEPPEGFSESSQ